MSWITGLKEWNAGKGTWCVPKKGTTGHAEVMAIINRKSAPAPSKAQTKTKEETDEDARVAKMRLYLAQRKIFSRLKDPIRGKLETVNKTRVDDMGLMDEWKDKLNDLLEKWSKSKSYIDMQERKRDAPGHGSMDVDPMDLLNPTTDDMKKTAASKYGKLIIAHLNKKPVIAKDVGNRYNTKPGYDEIGMKGTERRAWHDGWK